MTNINKIREEYDLKKLSLALLLVLGIIGGIFAGLMLVQGRIDIRNRAANSCPIGSVQTVVCKFTVQSDVPFSYVVVVTSTSNGDPNTNVSGEPFVVTNAEKTVTPSGGSITIEESVENVPYAGNYSCDVSVKAVVTNACGSRTSTDQKTSTVACTPNDGPPGDPTNTPTPTPPQRQSSPVCKDCSKVDLTIDFTDPGRPQPTLTPPNINDTDLKIGRLKLSWTTNACGTDPNVCDNVDKIEFSAYNNATCSGPTVAPTPANQENRYGDAIKCSEASKDTGALFRLHEANGSDCRCYEATLKFKEDPTNPDAPLFCPDTEKLVLCCATTCKAPEIIDDPDDPNDGCIGDPSGNYPGNINDPNRTKCYFDPVPQCFKPNLEARFETHASGAGDIDYDEDFEGLQDNVGAGDEEHRNTYQNGGSYDIKMKCNVGGNVYTCKKRVRVACTGVDAPPGNPPGGGNPPACVLPEIVGVCTDQPQPTL